MNKVELFIMRRQKKIKLKDIAQFLGCSISLISRYENDICEISKNYKEKYEQYITQK